MTLKQLSILELEAQHKASPNYPKAYLVPKKYTDKSTNELQKAVKDFLILHGCQAERIANKGTYKPPAIVEDFMGNKRTMGKGQWIKGHMRLGTSDVHSTVPINIKGITIGVSVKWEIKCKATKDKASDDQKDYAVEVQNAGGYVFFVKDWESFIYHWNYLHSQHESL